MAANVPITESGSARLGISVAETFRRNRKITSTTSTMASSSENFTSSTDSRMDSDRSYNVSMLIAGGSWARNCGNSARTLSTTSTVLVPGCRITWNMMEGVLLSQVDDFVVLHAVDHFAQIAPAAPANRCGT